MIYDKTCNFRDHPSSTVEKAIWVLRCKDWTQKDIPCPHWKLNRKHDLATLANFVKILTYPTVVCIISTELNIVLFA